MIEPGMKIIVNNVANPPFGLGSQFQSQIVDVEGNYIKIQIGDHCLAFLLEVTESFFVPKAKEFSEKCIAMFHESFKKNIIGCNLAEAACGGPELVSTVFFSEVAAGWI